MCDELCICCPKRRKKVKRSNVYPPTSSSRELSVNNLNRDISGFEINFQDSTADVDTTDVGIPNTSFQGDNIGFIEL